MPPIQLDPPVCDFGFVAPGQVPTKSVTLKNVGTTALLIRAVSPSCKCTTVNDIVGTELQPGGTVALDASMRAQSGINSRGAEVKVLIDGFERPLTVPLRIETSLPVRVTPAYINAVKGGGRTGRLVLESLDKREFSVCSVAGRAPSFVGFDPTSDQPQNKYVIEYDVGAFKEEEIPRYLCIETDHPDCPMLDVFFRHERTNPVSPTFKLNEYRYTFGRIEQGSEGTFTVEVNDLPEGEELTEITTTMPGASIRWLEDATRTDVLTKRAVAITPPKDFVGLLYMPFTVHSNVRSQRIDAFGLVVPKGHAGCLGLMQPMEGQPWSLIWSPTAPKPSTPPAPTPKAQDLAPVTGG